MINREWTIWNARKCWSSHESSQDRDPSLDKEKLNWKNTLTRFSILFLSSKPLFWHRKLNFKSRCLTFIENFDKPPTSYGLFFQKKRMITEYLNTLNSYFWFNTAVWKIRLISSILTSRCVQLCLIKRKLSFPFPPQFKRNLIRCI